MWTSFFDEAEFAGNEGKCELDVGRATKRRPLLEFARGRQRGYVRNRSLYTVRLATATLERRDVAGLSRARRLLRTLSGPE